MENILTVAEQELYENVDKPPQPRTATTLKPSPQPKNLLKPAPQPKGGIVRKLSEAWEQKKKENAANPERQNTFPSRKVTPPTLVPTSRRPDDNDIFEEGKDVKPSVKDNKEHENAQKSSSKPSGLDSNSSATETSKSSSVTSSNGSGKERKSKSTARKKSKRNRRSE